MKFTLAAITWLTLPHYSTAFVSSSESAQRNTARHAAEDIPDLVKAYRKAKEALPDISVEGVATADFSPVDVPDVPVDIPIDVSPIQESVSTAIPKLTSTNAVNDFIQTARDNYQNMRSVIIDSPRSPSEASNLAEYTRQNLESIKASVSLPDKLDVRDVKVPSVSDVVGQLKSTNIQPPPASPEQVERISNAQSKFAIMVENAQNLLGVNGHGPPSFEALDGVAWVVAGFAFLLAAGQRRAGLVDARIEMEDLIAKELKAVEAMATDLETLNSEIAKLNKQTVDLKTELKVASDKLEKKDDEIAKERQKLAKKEARMKAELERTKQKAKEESKKVASLEAVLKDTKQVREQLVTAVKQVEELQDGMEANQDAFEFEDNLFFATEPEPMQVDELESMEVNGAVGTLVETPPAKAAKKVKAKTKKTAKKAKKATKKTIKVKAAAKSSRSNDWSELSPSTLQRKTVKDLVAYLEEKGIETTDENGKVLQKKMLIEAVKA